MKPATGVTGTVALQCCLCVINLRTRFAVAILDAHGFQFSRMQPTVAHRTAPPVAANQL